MSISTVEELFSLKGKTALITGASSGLGEHFAKVMSQAGANVVLAARRKEKLDGVVDTIKAAGGEASAVSMDVTSVDSVEQAFNDIDAIVDSLDILINNAGVEGGVHRFEETSEDTWDFVLDTNLNGAARVARFATKRMVAAKQGVIVNIGSLFGLRTSKGTIPYNVSKAALNQLTNGMATELSRDNIRVNTLSPGFLLTELNEHNMTSEGGKMFIKSLLPRRLGELHELDGALLLLASDAGSYINGANLVVDGGSQHKPI